jgi:hypothetical protein
MSRVVLQDQSRRDVVVSGLWVIGLAAVLGFGFWKYASTSPSAYSNTLKGVILEKQFTPEREQLITYGRKGLKTKESDGEYLFKVRVPPGNTVMEVPVDRGLYQAKKVGDSVTFLRPEAGK